MKSKILGLFVAGCALAMPAMAQVQLHVPSAEREDYLMERRYYYLLEDDGERNYYNNYADRRGFWVDGNGYARWDSGFFTGWREGVFYREGQPYRYRDPYGSVRYYRVLW